MSKTNNIAITQSAKIKRKGQQRVLLPELGFNQVSVNFYPAEGGYCLTFFAPTVAAADALVKAPEACREKE